MKLRPEEITTILKPGWGNPWFPHGPPPSRFMASGTTWAALGQSPAPPTTAAPVLATEMKESQ